MSVTVLVGDHKNAFCILVVCRIQPIVHLNACHVAISLRMTPKIEGGSSG